MLDQWNRANHSATMRAVNNGNSLCVSDATTTARAIGLLHVAASGGHPEAQLSLALRQDSMLTAGNTSFPLVLHVDDCSRRKNTSKVLVPARSAIVVIDG